MICHRSISSAALPALPVRRWLVAALFAISLGAMTCPRAEAQIPVTDVASLGQEVKSYLQDLKSYATQLQQLQQAAQQVQWAISTYESFVHDPSLGGAMALLGQSESTIRCRLARMPSRLC
jgi:hypothetical protein